MPLPLLTGDHVAARALRFASVGAANSAVYAAVTAGLVQGLGVAPVAASIAGYCVAVPLGFAGHRGISFRSRRRWTREAARFVVAQAVSLAVTACAMGVAVASGASYVWGMVGAVALVPVANFLLMHFWVFPDRAGRAPTRG